MQYPFYDNIKDVDLLSMLWKDWKWVYGGKPVDLWKRASAQSGGGIMLVVLCCFTAVHPSSTPCRLFWTSVRACK